MTDTQLFIVPAQGKEARAHFETSILHGVDPAELLSVDHLGDLVDGRTEPVRMWGALGGGGTPEKAWKRLSPGDLCLFYTQGHFPVGGRVWAIGRSDPVARRIWGADKDGRAWECIWLFDETFEVGASSEAVRIALDRAEKARFQNFTRVSDEAQERLRATYGSIEAFVEHLRGQPLNLPVAIGFLASSVPYPQGGNSAFELGRIYNRQQEIHGVYGGQKYGGISTPTAHPLVLIFSGDEGAAYGYADEELPGGGLLYYGEGQSGDMQMVKGNRAIRDHVTDGKTLHLFKKVRDGFAQYAGEFEFEADELRPNTPDGDGNLRTAIAFRLRPKTPGAGSGVPPEVADAVDAVAAIAAGQGFSQRLTATDRKAIEMRAMDVATRHFEGLGYEVKDVSNNQPYDLRCSKGVEQLDVEAKGTTTAGETVLLTPNEVQHALTTHPRTALAVVRAIELHDAGAPSATATGGTLEVHLPWRPLDIDLTPVGYTYTVPQLL